MNIQKQVFAWYSYPLGACLLLEHSLLPDSGIVYCYTYKESPLFLREDCIDIMCELSSYNICN